MGAWGMHLDFSPDIAGGALFPYLESMANQSFGMVIGQGGADTMIKAMVARLEALGGSVTLNAEVAEIVRKRRARRGRAPRRRRDHRGEARGDRRRHPDGARRQAARRRHRRMPATTRARRNSATGRAR